MPKSSNTSRLIVIEGLDGSGKATQAGLLAESLTAAGTPVRRISFRTMPTNPPFRCRCT